MVDVVDSPDYHQDNTDSLSKTTKTFLEKIYYGTKKAKKIHFSQQQSHHLVSILYGSSHLVPISLCWQNQIQFVEIQQQTSSTNLI